jgi:hypothetical protein
MPSQTITAVVDGVPCTLALQSDGSLLITHDSTQINPMQGPMTGGVVQYTVHPIQRHQYDFLLSLFPTSPSRSAAAPTHARPWWSYSGGTHDAHGPGRDSGGE